MKGFGSKKEFPKKNTLFNVNKTFDKALKLQNQGNFSEAKVHYESLIKRGLLDPRVFTNLGVIFQQEKQYQKSIELYKKSISAFPKSHEAYSNLGSLLLTMGQYDLAEDYLNKVVSFKSDFLMAYQNLFNLYLQTKQQDKAEKTIFKCLKLAPNNHLINSNLGRFLLEKGDLYKSRKYLEKAINLKPDFWIAYNNLATLDATTGNLSGAEFNLQKAIFLNPAYLEGYVKLGEIKIDLNKVKEAESLFLKSLEIDKDYAYGHSSLFRIYEKTNNLKKLKEALKFQQVNDKIKNEILLYESRVYYREKKYTKAKESIDKISLDWLKNVDDNTKINFWSFKGFIEDKSKNFENAYYAFTKSQLNLKYAKCDKNHFKNYIKDYEKNLNNKNFFAKRDSFSGKNKIVFLLGFPRSGTTLLDTVLRSHPEIDVVEEKPIINSLENIIKNQFKIGLDEIYNLNEEQVNKLRKFYLANILNYSEKKNAQVLIDKFPFQTVCLPLINFIFPEAKIIFTHRHPYDTVLSCFQQAFEPNNAMANLRSLKESSEIYDLSMSMWVKYKKNLGLNLTMSKYESLIKNFDIHTKKILNFLDLEWDVNIRDYRNTALNREKINTPSSSQVVQPLYKTSISKWENYKNYFNDCHVFLEKWVKYFDY